MAFRTLLEAQSFRFEPGDDFDPHLFTRASSSPRLNPPFEVHVQEGGSFGQKFENALATLVALGYHEIVVVGQDCPDLRSNDIRRTFELLETHRLVLGPDHRGGCYLIGLHASDAERLHRVRWQRNTDFRQICRRFAADAVAELPVKLDLDTWEDVWLLAASKSPFRWIVKLLLDSLFTWLPVAPSSTPPSDSEQRIFWQLPPPLDASLV